MTRVARPEVVVVEHELVSGHAPEAELREFLQVLRHGRTTGVVALLSDPRWPRLTEMFLAGLRRAGRGADTADDQLVAAAFLRSMSDSAPGGRLDANALHETYLVDGDGNQFTTGWRAGAWDVMEKHAKGHRAAEKALVTANYLREFRLRAVQVLAAPFEQFLSGLRPFAPGNDDGQPAHGRDPWTDVVADLVGMTPKGRTPDSLDAVLADPRWTGCFAHFLRLTSDSGPGLLDYLLSRARGDTPLAIVRAYLDEPSRRTTAEGKKLSWDLTWMEAVTRSGATRDTTDDAALLAYVEAALSRYDHEARSRLNRLLTQFRSVAKEARRQRQQARGRRKPAMPALDAPSSA